MTLQAYTARIVSIPEMIYTMSNIRELKAQAKEERIKGYSRLSKADLITRLTAKTLWDEETAV